MSSKKIPSDTLPDVIQLISMELSKAQEEAKNQIIKITGNNVDDFEAIAFITTDMINRKAEEYGLTTSKVVNHKAKKKINYKELSLSAALFLSTLGDDLLCDGDIINALEMLCMANRFLGEAEKEDFALEKISHRARTAALKGHSANHAMKAKAIAYYEANINSFKSMDSAAEQIAGNIVPRSFRRVREWITEYHKNLRTAGTT